MAPTKQTRGKRSKQTARGSQRTAQPTSTLRALPKLDARRDTLDFRDLLYTPTLIEVPTTIPLQSYQKIGAPILDQGTEGACTGFGLATVAHYLLRKRKVVPDRDAISPYMLYTMAKRYDEWPGEAYEGSSARGAMKAWHKHGICSIKHWPPEDERNEELFRDRWRDAVRRPLGAYFRVNHHDLVAMHAALAEVGVLYATAIVHDGWQYPTAEGLIPFPGNPLGGHAFAIVAYDERGFWIQNSWNTTWGKRGFGLISYDDWFANGTDVWVARLGAPARLTSAMATATGITTSAKGSRSYVFADLRPHIISVGNNGELHTSGTYGTSRADVREILQHEFLTITENWTTKRLLLYAHGGLVGEDSAIQRVADHRATLLDHEIYPLAFLWHTDYWTTITNILEDTFRRRRPEGLLDATKDFMLDRLDDALEPLARTLSGKASWSEMKQNALLATTSEQGAARAVIEEIAALPSNQKVELHVVGHSAGSVFHAPFVNELTTRTNRSIQTCTLWAPACTISLFEETYLPAVRDHRVERLAIFLLTDQAERSDHCANIYHKSLLYLVSNALEEHERLPLFGGRDGEPLLGMHKFLATLPSIERLDLVLAPNQEPVGSRDASRSTSHGGFDDDKATLQATLARILAIETTTAAFRINRSASSQRDLRTQLPEA